MTIHSIRRSPSIQNPQPPSPLGATLRQGSRGEAVRELQNLLISSGYRLTADGAFGPKTRDAVIAFQRAKGLGTDGIVGPKTWQALRGSAPNSADVFDAGKVQNNKPSIVTPPATTSTAEVNRAAAERLAKATALVRGEGSATEADVAAVAQGMAKLPASILDAVAANKVKVIACRGSVTDYMTELKGVRPRGWPPGATWDDVPGCYSPAKDEVVIATIAGRNDTRLVPAKGQGQGSVDMVFHEIGHSLDDTGALRDHSKNEQAFIDAYTADTPALKRYGMSYLLQEGEAGRSEAFAETFALYFSGNPSLKTRFPAIFEYWQKVEAELAKS